MNYKKHRESEIEVVIFCLVWFLLKKNNQIEFFLKEPKQVQTDRFWLGLVFLGKNPVQTGLA
jgi:hypothetical protein